MATTTYDSSARPSSRREARAAADPRGRAAATPLHIPARGWKEILIRTWKEIQNNRILLVAAGCTFYLLLALVPSLTALISIYGLFNDPASVQEQLGFVQEWMPEGGRQILTEQLARITSQASTSLSFAAVLSLGVALWSSNAGVKALIEAMNVAYGEQEKRGFIRLTLTSLAMTLGAILLLLLLIGVIVLLPVALNLIGMGATAGTGLAVRIGSGLALALAGLLALSSLYRWGPSRQNARWKWATPGAAIALVVAMITSTLFSWYVARFGSYNETYGSLGAVIGFMTWLWIMMAFVVAGAELNAEMEHQTARDSTTGPERPIGTRGARVADSVADGADDVSVPSEGLSVEQPPEQSDIGQAGSPQPVDRARRTEGRPPADGGGGSGMGRPGASAFGVVVASGLTLLLLARDLANDRDGDARRRIGRLVPPTPRGAGYPGRGDPRKPPPAA